MDECLEQEPLYDAILNGRGVKLCKRCFEMSNALEIKNSSFSENPADWYTEVVLKSEIADFAPIKGCMVIRPRGYSIWEMIQKEFNFGEII